VFAPFRAHWCEERIRGVCNAVLHRKLPPDTVQIMRGNDQPWQFNEAQFPFTHAAVTKARAQGWDFGGGIIAIHDIVSFGLAYMSTARDLLPGRDYALIGFDDHPVSRHAGLSSVRLPLEAMAREAGRVVLTALEGRPAGMVTKMQGELVVRSSSTLSGPNWLTAEDYRHLFDHELGYGRWEAEGYSC
jgi:DNA-binding LacI/PurR family transcriptional regulator